MTDHPNRSAGSAREPSLNCPECGALLWDYPDGRQTCSRCEWEEKRITDVAQGAALRAAAERVCWFDWSDNDMDAVAAIDALRKVITSQPSPAATVETRDLKVSGEVIAELMDECEALRAQLRLSAATGGERRVCEPCGFSCDRNDCAAVSQAASDEMEDYRMALAWIERQSTDPKSRELASTALSRPHGRSDTNV